MLSLLQFNYTSTLKKYISGSSYKGIILEILQLHISACCLPGAVYSYLWSSAFSLMQVKKLHKFSKSRHCIMNDCGRLNRPSNQVKCTHVFTCAGQKKRNLPMSVSIGWYWDFPEWRTVSYLYYLIGNFSKIMTSRGAELLYPTSPFIWDRFFSGCCSFKVNNHVLC